jgi:hypothetical protein
VHDRELRQRCQKIIDELELPEQFSVRDLVQSLGQRRGRPMHLIPLRLPAGAPCGAWFSTGDFDAIFYEADTSPLHQEHIISHELGHILFGHGASATIDADIARQLLPDLDPRLVRRLLCRTTYSAVEEQQAEIIASLISRSAHRHGSDRNWVAPPELADVFTRLAQTLEHRPRPQHG